VYVLFHPFSGGCTKLQRSSLFKKATLLLFRGHYGKAAKTLEQLFPLFAAPATFPYFSVS
jgi:hypothetical protein